MAKNATREMTSGSPLKLILSFAVPLLLGMLFQQFYSMVDTIIVGKSLGVDQLAGVGSTGAINFMIIGFCNGVCSGFAIPIAQSFGAKDYKRLRKFVANAAWLSIAFAAVMTVVVCVLCRQILSWMDTPENIFEYAYSYIFIIFLGIPATYLYNLLSGIIRSLGDSRTPVIFLVRMYATPLFYPITALPETLQKLMKLNPLYHYINLFRNLMMYGNIPGPNTWIACIFCAVASMAIGLLVFRKLQKNFILYI